MISTALITPLSEFSKQVAARVTAAPAVVLVFLVGCSGNSVGQAQFEQLKVGMNAQQVEAILGKEGKPIATDDIAVLLREALAPKDGKAGTKMELPDLSGAKGVRWGDDHKSITVIYMGDRVNRVFKKGF